MRYVFVTVYDCTLIEIVIVPCTNRHKVLVYPTASEMFSRLRFANKSLRRAG
jgi:hypothetical protein